MKINQSQEICITPETAVSTYRNGETYCCVLIEQGESLTLSFDNNCLEQLAIMLAQLQQIQAWLIEDRQLWLEKETKLLSSYKATPQVLLPFSDLSEF